MPKRKKRRRGCGGATTPQPRKVDVMRFVVGSSAGADGVSSDFDLGHKPNLVKGALLYAESGSPCEPLCQPSSVSG